jgi:tripeptidyl-peptidase-1
VSDPKNPKYGQHLSIDDVTKLLNVPEPRVSKVAEYFKMAGAESVEVAPNKDMITVSISAAAAEKALKTKLGFFTHSERHDIRIVRSSTTYHLPAEIDSHVVLVGELLRFPRLRLQKFANLTKGAGSWPNACSASGCAGLVTPDVLAQRYKFPKPSDSAAASSMAVAEFQGQYFKNSDLSTFGKSCHRNVAVDHIIGGDSQEAGVEAELDIEYIKAVAPQVPLTVIYSS